MSHRSSDEWERKFWRNIVVHDEHWLWQGKTRTGSPVIRAHRQERSAMRVAWMIEYGTVPPPSRLLRDCDEPLCVNPAHRRVRETVQVGSWCRYGEHVIVEPPYWHGPTNGWRCRTCRRKYINARNRARTQEGKADASTQASRVPASV